MFWELVCFTDLSTISVFPNLQVFLFVCVFCVCGLPALYAIGHLPRNSGSDKLYNCCDKLAFC